MMMSSRCKVVIAALLVVLVVVDASKHLKRIKHQLKAAAGASGNYDDNGMSSFSFLVVGDWGRKGEYNQSMVATQMGKVGEKLDVEFIISTGDNFYDDGLTGVNDPAFIESFTNIYTAPALQKQWFNVLGNHDYRGDVEAQLSPALRRKDKRWFCLRSYIIEASSSVDFFMVDTTPFVDKYFTDPEDHTYDWSGITPRDKYLSTLLNDLDLALSESKASWKIVVGHHTIKSAGHHGNTEELILHLLPILHQNKVDFYINGHDHCLERIVSSHKSHAIEFITSGGGSKAWRGDEQSWDPNQLKFYYDGQGFLSAQLNASYIHFEFYDVYGQSLYHWDSFKELRYDV